MNGGWPLKVKLSPLGQIEVIRLPNKGDSKSVLYLGITILKQLSRKVERIREKDIKHFYKALIQKLTCCKDANLRVYLLPVRV